MRSAQKPVTGLSRVMLPHDTSLGPEPPSPIPGALDARIQRARFSLPMPGAGHGLSAETEHASGKVLATSTIRPVFLASRAVVQTYSLGPFSGTKGAGALAGPHRHPKHSTFLGDCNRCSRANLTRRPRHRRPPWTPGTRASQRPSITPAIYQEIKEILPGTPQEHHPNATRPSQEGRPIPQNCRAC